MSLLDDLLTTAVKNSYEKNKRKESEPSILGALKDPQFLQDMKRGVLDSVNRGAVASTIGGPVDLATMVMRLGGYNVEKPVGGSEWVGDKMQQLGLLGDTRNPIAEAIASVAVPGAMTKAGQGLFKAEQAAIKNAQIAGPLSDGKFATQRGVFGGLNAKTADKAKLSQAEQMLSKGVDPAQVWKETGWGRGPDGKWRFEIPDDAARMDAHSIRYLESAQATNPLKTGKLSDVMTHRKAYGAYPEAQDIGIDLTYADRGAAYIPRNAWGDPEQIAIGNVPDYRSATLHELQHAIQQREGFARGGSPEGLKEALANDAFALRQQARALDSSAWRNDPLGPAELLKPGARKKALDLEKEAGKLNTWVSRIDEFGDNFAHDAYKHLGGEAEARLVQSRMNLTPEQRLSQYPWAADYFKQQTGVGLDDLIHRFDGGEAKSVGFTYPQDAALETARKNGVKMLGLPENNTALDRAAALGIDQPVYRGTSANETTHAGNVWVTDEPKAADYYTGYVNQDEIYPMLQRHEGGNVMPLLGSRDVIHPENGTELWNGGSRFHVPANSIRSRFAAFDPARVNESDLLAGAMPFGLLADEDMRAKFLGR